MSSTLTAPYRHFDESATFVAEFGAEAAVILRPDDFWSAALASAAGVPNIVSGDHPEVSRYATHIAPASRWRHRVAQALEIATCLTNVPSPEPNWRTNLLTIPKIGATSHLTDFLSAHDRFAVVHPGSGAPVKLWLPHRWRVAIAALERRGLQVVLTGGSGERAMCEEIRLDTSAINLAGRTSLDSLVQTLSASTVAIGTDNGPMHLAVAAGTPSVHLFGPSDPHEFGPWGDPCRHHVVHARWSCPRCRDLSLRRPEGCGCMLAISTSDVLDAVDRVLS